MNKQRIARNHFNYRENRIVTTPKCCQSKSITVPDLALSVDELLLRHQKGLPLPTPKIPFFQEDGVEQIPRSVSQMDLIDLHYYKKDAMQRLQLLNENIEKVNAQRKLMLDQKNEQYKNMLEFYKTQKQNPEQGDGSTNTP